MRTAVIFDLDGVLVDSRVAIGRSINHALAAHGLPVLDEARLAPLIGPPLLFSFAHMLGTTAEDPRAQAVLDSYRERYVEHYLGETTVFAGIPQAVAALAAVHRLGMATSKPKAYAEPLLAALGLRAHFDVVEGPALEAPAESKSETLGRALAALEPGRAVMIGDRSHDLVGARDNGIPAIAVTWGIGDRAELAGADVLVDAPDELVSAAARLLG